VLVVDDGEENRELLQLVLEDFGLEVGIAENGESALELATAFDIILMDVQMPVMDGYTAVGIMRERGLTQPVVALTAEAMEGAERRCLDAGYSRYLSKPIDIDRLMALLAAELGAVRDRRMPSSEGEVTAGEIIQPVQAPVAGSEPVRSSLPMDKPNYRHIAEKFVARLKGRLDAVRLACSNENLPEIAQFAHWLKGSAGSVGFHAFTEPAKAMEQLTRDGRLDGVSEILDLLENMHSRIELDGEGNVDSTLAAVTRISAKYTSMPEVIESSLSGHNPRFHDIVSKFAAKLDLRLQDLDLALEQGDFAALASFAHWLKGSAGSVGFDAFTQSAAELEIFAHGEQLAGAGRCMDTIKEMNRRIVLQQQDSTEAGSRSTIESS
jgi:CheY-like chemotaxis protein